MAALTCMSAPRALAPVLAPRSRASSLSSLRTVGIARIATLSRSRALAAPLRLRSQRAVRVSAEVETEAGGSAKAKPADAELSKMARQAATTFAPRSSTAKKNPATKGTVLYQVFEVQAYLAIVVGGLLAFNVIYPSDEPSIARLMGMWSLWMFTVPSLRARDCIKEEKDALNYAFLAIPLVNVLLPFVWKSFAAVYVADVGVLAALYAWKDCFPWSECRQDKPAAAAAEVEEPSA